MITKSVHRHKQTLELTYALEPSSLPTLQWKARDSLSSHLPAKCDKKTNLSHILSHNFPLFCSLRTHTKAVREKESIAKGRASCMLWVSNHIMRGLQHLVGAPFIATVKTNMKLFTLTEGVCACMHMCPETDEKLTRGILRMAKKGSQERRKE